MDNYFNRKYKGKEQRLNKVLSLIYPELSYSELMKLIRKKDVFVNGKKISGDITINNGDMLNLFYKPSEINIKEIYYDDNMLILYKNKGIVSDGEYSFEGIVKYKYGDTVKLLHRLDTNTDGLLVFSRNAKAYQKLREAMREHKIDKYYYARVNGRIQEKEKTLKGYLVKNSNIKTVKIYDKQISGGDYVEANIKVLSYDGETTYLEVMIHSGKTHQIRAQLAHYGHFILGDSKYGNDEINRSFGIKKQQLTAYKIVFNVDKDQTIGYLSGKGFSI